MPLSFSQTCIASIILVTAAAAAASPPSAVAPRSGNWSDVSYYLPAPDGTRLAISWYFPSKAVPSQALPVVLVQTRYGRATQAPYALRWQRAGYAVAVLDTRGSTASFGPRNVDIGPDEIHDMDAVIAHVASRPWSNGQVIASGVSYMADTADMATSRHAPALIAAIPRETDFDTYLNLFYPGGVANDFMMRDWGGYALEIDSGRDGAGKGLNCASQVKDCATLFPTLQPVDEDPDYVAMRQALADRRHWAPETYAATVYRDDPGSNGLTLFSSSPASQLAAIRREKKPVQYWGSWVDAGTAEAALARFRSTPGIATDVWITANNHGHGVGADPLLPDRRAPLPSVDEQFQTNLAFAQAARNGQARDRTIHYYVMGAAVMRETRSWPPREIVAKRYAFDAGHRLVSGRGAVGVDSYEVDFTATTGKTTRWSTQFGPPPAYTDRHDEDQKLLVYDTDPMKRDMLLAGYPIVTLRVATRTKDPAFFIYLEDIAPDGRVSYVTEGMLRAIHRKAATLATLPYDQGPAAHSFRRADSLSVEPGKAMDVRFALFPTAALLRAGHRLRVAIAGADADTFHRYSDAQAESFNLQRAGSVGSSIEVPLAPWSGS